MSKKGYEEDGEILENLSAFTGQGFDSMPNFYLDNQNVRNVADLSDRQLIRKYNEYTDWSKRTDIMPRAKTAAARVLKHLSYEYDYRCELEPDDITEFQKLEDEACDGNA